MNVWHDIDPARIKPEDFLAVIEIPKGSKKKYELDKQTGLIILDRILYTSTHYPANYGFIPRSYGDDGDPLDVLVLCSEVLDPLTLVRCYPIGYISMLDGGKNDEKIIAIPFSDPSYNKYRDIMDLPDHTFDEMAHFFTVYKALEGKEAVAGDVNGREAAVEIIKSALAHYDECARKLKGMGLGLCFDEDILVCYLDLLRSRGEGRLADEINAIVPDCDREPMQLP